MKRVLNHRPQRAHGRVFAGGGTFCCLWKKRMPHMALLASVVREIAAAAVLAALAGVVCLPVALLFSGSLTGKYEMHERLLPMVQDGGGYVSWRWIPEFPDFSEFGRLLLQRLSFSSCSGIRLKLPD